MNNFEVALVKELCFICNKEIDGPIVINSLLTEKAANEVKQLHGKCVGYSDKLCPECQKLANQGLIILEIDSEKSESNNPYRTGKLWVIKEDCDLALDMKEKGFVINKFGCNFVFIDQEATKELGFYE